jgi:glutathione S-transferase
LRESVYTRIVLLTLEEKEVAYDFEDVDMFGDEGIPGEYLERHPFGRIPAFSYGHFNLYETAAITRYVDEAFSGQPLQPESPRWRARMNQAISMLDSYAYRSMIWDVFVERLVVPEEGGSPNEATIKNALATAEACVQQLESWLSVRPFLAGQRLSLADLHATPMLLYFFQTPEGAELLGSAPALQDWLTRMTGRVSVKSTKSVYG